MKYVQTKLILAVVAGLFFVAGCKKHKDAGDDPTPPVDPGAGTPTAEEKTMDTVYLYSKEFYLWNDLIPAYDAFNPRQYKSSTPYKSDSVVLSKIRKLQPLDRYSFITTPAVSDGLSTGEDKDLGFFLKAGAADLADPIDSVYWYVTYVYKNSTAGIAGVKRGWIINKINGTKIGYDNPSINILNEVFFGATQSASFEFIKPDQTTSTASLSKTSFVANSVLYRNVLSDAANGGTHKVGYLVFNQFFGQPSRDELSEAFTYFGQQGVNELVVDLRYNPGGSTETQDTLSNFISPMSANNQTMYKYTFNASAQTGTNIPLVKKLFGIPATNTTAFSEAANTVKFSKAGTLNLSRVFFITTGGTASASELTINNLKPYMDVKLIGDTTYGKPVGFFGIPVGNAVIYPISFKTTNSAGNADYYSGFAPDKFQYDGIDKDWGDTDEPCLYSALSYISNGTYGKTTARSEKLLQAKLAIQNEIKPVQQYMESGKFNGMFADPRRFK